MLVLAQDPASLENLHDIVTPAPTSAWPPAFGWYVIGALILITCVLLIVQAIRNWWQNRYRTAAIGELNHLRNAIQKSSNQSIVGALDHILKRVALAAWPREDVARLSGDRWIEFLNRNANLGGNAVLFEPEQIRVLRDSAYSSKISDELSDLQIEELFATVEQWIRRHPAPIAETKVTQHRSVER